MSAYKAAYRLTLYAPRSVDPTEATVLTPIDTTIHNDPFQVASIPGVSGFQPYLYPLPQGRRGRIDYKSRRLDTGTFTFKLIDKKLASGDELKRWFTAFVGNAKGLPRGRLRCVVEESLDQGATWVSFALMELVRSVSRKNEIELQLRDRTETLKMRAWTGAPHSSITYAARPSLLPVGFYGSDYGPFKVGKGITAVVYAEGTYAPSTTSLVHIKQSVYPDDNILTKELVQAVGIGQVFAYISPFQDPSIATAQFGVPPDFSGTCRCHLKRLDNSAEGNFKATGVFTTPLFRYGQVHDVITSFVIEPLDTTDVNYLALPPDGTNVEVYLYSDQPVSDVSPLLLSDVDPAQLIQDLCDGKFSVLFRFPEKLPAGKAYGDVKRIIATNGVSAFLATRPASRYYLKASEPVIDVIERICFENHWSPYLDALGRLNLVDLRLPITLAGLATIVDADCVADQDGEWEDDPTAAVSQVKVTFYEDVPLLPKDLWAQAEPLPSIGSGVFTEIEHPKIALYSASLDYGDQTLNIDARSYRAVQGEVYQGQPRAKYLERMLDDVVNQLRRPLETGEMSLPLACRRTATILGLKQGSLVLVNVSWVVDPSSHKRGGTRLCRVMEYSEDGPAINLRLLDLAINVVAATPTLGAPAQEAGNTYGGVTTAVTLNASAQPVEISVAVTGTGVGSAPIATSPLWTSAGLCTSTSTFVIRDVPPNSRIWVRGRTYPIGGLDIGFPSDWVAAGGTGRVDTAALAAPSALSASGTTNTTTKLSWTSGAADALVEILAATPTSDPRIRIAILPPRTTSFDIKRLLASTTYRFEVRHAIGPYAGPGATLDVTTGSGAKSVPDIAGFAILQ